MTASSYQYARETATAMNWCGAMLCAELVSEVTKAVPYRDTFAQVYVWHRADVSHLQHRSQAEEEAPGSERADERMGQGVPEEQMRG